MAIRLINKHGINWAEIGDAMAHPSAECCDRYHKQIKHQGIITRGVYIATVLLKRV